MQQQPTKSDKMEIRISAPNYGQLVDVYLNLNKKGFFSIRDSKTNKVIAYAESVTLKDVNFKIRPSGRKRTIEGYKEVHAWATGIFIQADTQRPESFGKCINYRPRENDYFYDIATAERVDAAEALHLSACKCWTQGEASAAAQAADNGEQISLF
jgi:hypothetical protein